MREKPTTKKVKKAWAVLDEQILRKDGTPFGMIYSLSLESFSEAIFPIEENAHEYARRISKGFKAIVVPCTITYTVPDMKRRPSSQSY